LALYWSKAARAGRRGGLGIQTEVVL